MFSAILEYVPQPDTPEELAEIFELKVKHAFKFDRGADLPFYFFRDFLSKYRCGIPPIFVMISLDPSDFDARSTVVSNKRVICFGLLAVTRKAYALLVGSVWVIGG